MKCLIHVVSHNLLEVDLRERAQITNTLQSSNTYLLQSNRLNLDSHVTYLGRQSLEPSCFLPATKHGRLLA